MINQELIWSDNKKSVKEIHIRVRRISKPTDVIKAHTNNNMGLDLGIKANSIRK